MLTTAHMIADMPLMDVVQALRQYLMQSGYQCSVWYSRAVDSQYLDVQMYLHVLMSLMPAPQDRKLAVGRRTLAINAQYAFSVCIDLGGSRHDNITLFNVVSYFPREYSPGLWQCGQVQLQADLRDPESFDAVVRCLDDMQLSYTSWLSQVKYTPYDQEPMPHAMLTDCGDRECDGRCNICVLGVCDACGSAEAALPSDCPGELMSNNEMDRVCRGEIDYVRGEWVLVYYPVGIRET